MAFRKVKRVPKCTGYCDYDDPDREVAIVKAEEAEGGYAILYNCPNVFNGKECKSIDEWRNLLNPPTYEKLIKMEDKEKAQKNNASMKAPIILILFPALKRDERNSQRP